MHSFFSSAITDWYIESLGEHIVDILHSGLRLWGGKTLSFSLPLSKTRTTECV